MGNYLKRSRHGTTLYFRRRVPDDLRPTIGRPFLTKSLETGDRREAIMRARLLAAKTDILFADLRAMPPKDHIRSDFGFKLDLNELGKAVSLTVTDVKPEDAEAITQIIREARTGPGSGPDASSTPHPTSAPNSPSTTLSDAVEEFLAQGGYTTATRRTYGSRLKRAIAHFGGERDIRTIGQADLSEFARHILAEVPDQNSAKLCITTLAGLLNHYRINNGWGPELTTKRLLPRDRTPDSDARDAYTLDQLRVLFENARLHLETEPAKFWVTIAAVFTGCRVEELAQIELPHNLGHDSNDDVWWLDLNAKPDADGKQRRSMKNAASWRMVPLHSAIVQAGFVSFLQKQAADGFSRPFQSQWKPLPDPNSPDEKMKWSHHITKWGGRELRELETKGKLLRRRLSYFHSMRHTVTQLLQEARIDAEVAEALLGRSYSKGDRERYAKLKTKPVLLSKEGVEPGLTKLAEVFEAVMMNGAAIEN